MQLNPTVNQEGIMRVIPHRPPKLLIDGITDLEEEKSAGGFRDVRLEDCAGNMGILSGGDMYEVAAQVTAYCLLSSRRFAGFYAVPKLFKVKTLRPVSPGDRLVLYVDILATKGSRGYAKGRGYVDGRLVFEASGGFRVMRPEVLEALKSAREMEKTAIGVLSLATG